MLEVSEEGKTTSFDDGISDVRGTGGFAGGEVGDNTSKKIKVLSRCSGSIASLFENTSM